MNLLVAGVGVVLLTAYLVAVAIAARATGAPAEQWARAMALLGGLESLAFVAGGWFFGKEASRKTIETMGAELQTTKQERHEARVRADAAVDAGYSARADVRVLAHAVRMQAPSRAQGVTDIEKGFSAGIGESGSTISATNDELQNLANELLARYDAE
jgi:hypothetical protein